MKEVLRASVGVLYIIKILVMIFNHHLQGGWDAREMA